MRCTCDIVPSLVNFKGKYIWQSSTHTLGCLIIPNGEWLFTGLDHWTGLLDWTTELTFNPNFQHGTSTCTSSTCHYSICLCLETSYKFDSWKPSTIRTLVTLCWILPQPLQFVKHPVCEISCEQQKQHALVSLSILCIHTLSFVSLHNPSQAMPDSL